jgi:gamma-glutamyltranspeptidase/glutathione hydrolase
MTGRLIADDMVAHGGTITMADLVAYRALERPPLRGTYRGYEVITMAPPSSVESPCCRCLGCSSRTM